MVRLSIIEKGDVAKVLEWFKSHRDDEYADILGKTVKENRDKLLLR